MLYTVEIFLICRDKLKNILSINLIKYCDGIIGRINVFDLSIKMAEKRLNGNFLLPLSNHMLLDFSIVLSSVN